MDGWFQFIFLWDVTNSNQLIQTESVLHVIILPQPLIIHCNFKVQEYLHQTPCKNSNSQSSCDLLLSARQTARGKHKHKSLWLLLLKPGSRDIYSASAGGRQTIWITAIWHWSCKGSGFKETSFTNVSEQRCVLFCDSATNLYLLVCFLLIHREKFYTKIIKWNI